MQIDYIPYIMYKCKECENFFETISLLANHVRWNHRDNSNLSTKISNTYDKTHGKIQKLEKFCETCEKPFTVMARKNEKRYKKSRFCSRSCANSVGGKAKSEKYGLGDKQYRKIAFSVYKHECEVCSYNELPDVLQVHHIDSDRNNNDVKNLVILCPTCHWTITLNKAIFSKDRKFEILGANELGL